MQQTTNPSKICPSCGEEKPLKHFGWRYQDPRNIYLGVHGKCRICRSTSRPPSALYQSLVDEHGEVCYICKQPETAPARKIKRGNGPSGPRRAKRLAIDHDHSCCPGIKPCEKCIRKLLCQQCNLDLGILEKLMPNLDNLLDYISSHRQK